MSKILTEAIRSKDTSERPIHCTDVKRETIYLRKDDAWKKDDDCEETKRLIQHIAHKNYKALSEWSKEHPEHTEPDTAIWLQHIWLQPCLQRACHYHDQ